MRMMTQILFSSMAVLAICCSSANAGLISVQFDDFTTANGAPETVFTSGSLSVVRTATLADATQFSGTNFSTAAVVPFNVFTLTYSVVGGTFGDVFATSGSGGGSFDGFSVSVVYSFGGEGMVSINGGLAQSLAAGGPNVFRNVAASGNTSASLVFQHAAGGTGSMTVTSVSAVPEPTALMLVVSAIGLCLTQRRRLRIN